MTDWNAGNMEAHAEKAPCPFCGEVPADGWRRARYCSSCAKFADGGDFYWCTELHRTRKPSDFCSRWVRIVEGGQE